MWRRRWAFRQSPDEAQVQQCIATAARGRAYSYLTNWGWEQGCFHNYYLEQRNGELPERCPRIVLDRAGHTMVHLAGNNQHFFKWTADTSSGAPQPHVVFKESHEKVCALHANGPAKKALRPIWRWWGENATGRPPAWA